MPLRIALFMAVTAVLVFRFVNYPYYSAGRFENNVASDALMADFEVLRDGLSEKILNLLPEPQSGLLAGMVLGVKTDIPKDFKEALRKTSTIHVVVVSGQNLTLLAGFIMSAAPLIGRKKAIATSLAGVVFYSLLTGLQIPVLRALIMVVFGYLSQIAGREKDSWWIITLVALLMLAYNPAWIYSVSFQLSFLATIGVVVIAPEVIQKVRFIPSILREDLAVSTAAYIMTLPVIASNFYQINVLGILVNTLILFTVPLIMVSGIATIILSIVSPILGLAVSVIPNIFLTYFVYVVSFFGRFDWASVILGKISPVFWVGYYVLVAGTFLSFRSRNIERRTD